MTRQAITLRGEILDALQCADHSKFPRARNLDAYFRNKDHCVACCNNKSKTNANSDFYFDPSDGAYSREK
jgi:hypothetical protein